MSETDEALKIWKALKPMIDKEIEEKTRSCVRAKKMQAKELLSSGKLVANEPYGDDVTIPCSTLLSQGLDTSYPATVTSSGSTASMRVLPDSSSTRLASVPVGTVVRVLDDSQTTGWWKIEYNAMTGYMQSGHLIPGARPSPYWDTAVWVWYYYNNASTMVAMTTGDGQLIRET